MKSRGQAEFGDNEVAEAEGPARLIQLPFAQTARLTPGGPSPSFPPMSCVF